MATLPGIAQEAARRAQFTAAVAATPDPATLAAETQSRLRAHWTRVIEAWTNKQSTDPEANVNNLRIPEGGLDAATLNAWESELTAAGYIVTRANGIFTISLTP